LTKIDFLNQCFINDSEQTQFKNCHPKQIISDVIPIPIWKIHYSYTTQRGNFKEANKYIIKDEKYWDGVENEFNQYIQSENEKHPERKISNVEILDLLYLGEAVLELE
jgi:hypothetical protein